MSLEYAVHGKFYVKSDVFDFGVLLLEIINGNINRRFSHPDHNHNLLGHVSTKSYIYSTTCHFSLAGLVKHCY